MSLLLHIPGESLSALNVAQPCSPRREAICWPCSAHGDAERAKKEQHFHLHLQWRCICHADRTFGEQGPMQRCGEGGIPNRHAAPAAPCKAGGSWKPARGCTTYLLPFTLSKRTPMYSGSHFCVQQALQGHRK